MKLYFEQIESVSEEDVLRINMNFDFVRFKNPSVTINLESMVSRDASTGISSAAGAGKAASTATMSVSVVMKMITQGSL